VIQKAMRGVLLVKVPVNYTIKAQARRRARPVRLRYDTHFVVSPIRRLFKRLDGPQRPRWAVFPGLLFALLFALQALVLLPYPGLQTDEALFGSVLYEPRNLELSVQVFKQKIPLMLISYLGSLKAALYAGLFRFWPPSLYSVRVPVILAGAATLWLFYKLVRETLGRGAAWIGALLLATDATFLLTTAFDWGPVALQHLLLLGGAYLLVRFQRTGRNRALAAAFFLFGLGLWDKAIFVWMLSGLSLGALALFGRDLARLFSLRRAGLALAALLLGASPLILYNLRFGGATFRGVHYSAGDVPKKALLLKSSLEGASLFGYLTREDDGAARAQPPDRLERLSLALSEAAGRPRRNLLVPALALSLALLPLYWRTPARRAVLLALVAGGAAWAQMAFNQDTGGSTHHVVLLWPLPHFIVAAALAEVSRRLGRAGRPLRAAAALAVAISGLLVTNEHLAQWIRHGPGPVWTEAVEELARRLEETPARKVVVADWGIVDSLRLLTRGRLPLYQAIDLASRDSLDPDQQRMLGWLLGPRDSVFVGHTTEQEVVPGAGARLEVHAARAGWSKQTLYVVRDRHRRAIFEVYRFEPTSAPSPPKSR
jgi:hypothetical protein